MLRLLADYEALRRSRSTFPQGPSTYVEGPDTQETSNMGYLHPVACSAYMGPKVVVPMFIGLLGSLMSRKLYMDSFCLVWTLSEKEAIFIDVLRGLL